MATISYNSIAEGIHAALKEKSAAEQQALMPGIVRFLAKRKLISKSEEILVRVRNIFDKESGHITAQVTSKSPLDVTTKIKIKESLKERYKVSEVTLEEKTDERMIGGFRVEIGDEVMDLTLKNKLRKLQEHLIKSAQ